MSKKFWTSFRIRWQISEKGVEDLIKCLVILSVWKQTLLCSSISWALCLLMVYHDTEKFELPTKSQALVLGIFVCNVFISDMVMKAKCLLLLKICWSWWIEGEVDLSKSNYTVWLTHIFLFVLSSTLNVFRCHFSRQITRCFLFGVGFLQIRAVSNIWKTCSIQHWRVSRAHFLT